MKRNAASRQSLYKIKRIRPTRGNTHVGRVFLFRNVTRGCGIDASIPSKLLTPHTTGQKPKMGVQNAELVSALHSHCRGHRFESGMLHALPSREIGRVFFMHRCIHAKPTCNAFGNLIQHCTSPSGIRILTENMMLPVGK